jgi:hypothetical protein
MSTIKKLPLDSVCDPFLADGAFDSTLPLSEDELLSHGWVGLAISKKHGMAVMASTWPSASCPGYVHYSCSGGPDFIEVSSKKPWKPAAIGFAVDTLLEEYELCAADLKWSKAGRAHKPDGVVDTNAASNEFVYFVTAGPFVKIGKTSGTPDGRIAALQTGCPYPMTLAAYESGGLREEAALHCRFAEYRVRPDGEWFRYEGALREYIATVAKGKAKAVQA